jgi:hypothetical protein
MCRAFVTVVRFFALDGGCEHFSVHRAGNRVSADRGSLRSRPLRRDGWRRQPTVQSSCCFAERDSVDSLYEGDRVTARVAPKADPAPGASSVESGVKG